MAAARAAGPWMPRNSAKMHSANTMSWEDDLMVIDTDRARVKSETG